MVPEDSTEATEHTKEDTESEKAIEKVIKETYTAEVMSNLNVEINKNGTQKE